MLLSGTVQETNSLFSVGSVMLLKVQEKLQQTEPKLVSFFLAKYSHIQSIFSYKKQVRQYVPALYSYLLLEVLKSSQENIPGSSSITLNKTLICPYVKLVCLFVQESTRTAEMHTA